jgi:hypothetical protein
MLEELQKFHGDLKLALLRIAENPEILEIGRSAIEKELVVFRDSRISEFTRGNGLVIREKDGKKSDVIRMGPERALAVGLKAIAEAL